jgi:hypothetical protein
LTFFELSKAKERLNFQTGDTADDTMLNNLGAEADNEILSELYIVANRYGKMQALPAVDVANGKIGGVAAPQEVKDASTNRVVSLYHAIKTKDTERSEYWMKLSKKALESFIIRYDSESELFSAWV